MVLCRCNAHRDGSPGKHKERNPAARLQLLEEIIGRNFKNRIRNKKDHERDCVLVVGHVCLGQEIIACRRVQDLCISNV